MNKGSIYVPNSPITLDLNLVKILKIQFSFKVQHIKNTHILDPRGSHSFPSEGFRGKSGSFNCNHSPMLDQTGEESLTSLTVILVILGLNSGIDIKDKDLTCPNNKV